MKNQSFYQDQLAASRWQLQHLIPSYYNPYFFFGLTNLLGAVAIYYSTRLLENVQPLEWLTIPAVFIFANFVDALAVSFAGKQQNWPNPADSRAETASSNPP